MPVLRRATDQDQAEWRPTAEGLWRWVIGTPELKLSEKFGNYQVRFPLTLTLNEQSRMLNEIGKPPDGVQQSYRTSYTVGLSLGYIKNGQYVSTKLIDFLAASLGSTNSRKFREWIGSGGGPPRPADLDDQQEELQAIVDWLSWWDNLEVYGTIRHQDSQDGTKTFANFAGPMAVGSLPGEKDEDYQAHGRGKLRAIIAASGETREDAHKEERAGATAVVATDDDPPAVRYTPDGRQVAMVAEDPNDLPF